MPSQNAVPVPQEPPTPLFRRFLRSRFLRSLKYRLLGNRLTRRLMTRNFKSGLVALGERNSYTFPMVWVTLDWSEADFPLWLSEHTRLPFESGSQRVVYSAHMLEHVEHNALLALLREAARVLKPGGAIRIEVPDADKLIAAYRANDRQFLDYFQSGMVHLIGHHPGVDEKYLEDHIVVLGEIANYIERDIDNSHVPVYAPREEFDRQLAKGLASFNDWAQSLKTETQRKSGGHANALTFDRLKPLLLEAGFHDVILSQFGKTDIPGLRLGRGPRRLIDSIPEVPARTLYSLYVEAFK